MPVLQIATSAQIDISYILLQCNFYTDSPTVIPDSEELIKGSKDQMMEDYAGQPENEEDDAELRMFEEDDEDAEEAIDNVLTDKTNSLNTSQVMKILLYHTKFLATDSYKKKNVELKVLFFKLSPTSFFLQEKCYCFIINNVYTSQLLSGLFGFVFIPLYCRNIYSDGGRWRRRRR